MTIEELELETFRQIRQKISSFVDNSSNDEIAGYVKGVVNLEKELYKKLENTPSLTIDDLTLWENKKGEIEVITSLGARIAIINNLVELKKIVDLFLEQKYEEDSIN